MSLAGGHVPLGLMPPYQKQIASQLLKNMSVTTLITLDDRHLCPPFPFCWAELFLSIRTLFPFKCIIFILFNEFLRETLKLSSEMMSPSHRPTFPTGYIGTCHK